MLFVVQNTYNNEHGDYIVDYLILDSFENTGGC